MVISLQMATWTQLMTDMNKVYGFEGEAKAKHGEQTYKLFADVFTARTLRGAFDGSVSN